jgi:hypothetical protein
VAELRAASFSADDTAAAMVNALNDRPGLSVSSSFTEYDSASESGREYSGDVELYRGSVAYTHQISDFKMGISASYIEQDLNFKSTDGSIGSLDTDVDGLILSTGATTRLAKIDLFLVGGWGQLNADSSLNSGTLNTQQETELFFAEATAVYNWITNESISIRPSLALGYQSIRMDRFSEVEGIGLGTFEETEYDELELDLPYVETGITAQYFGLDTFLPFARVSISKNLDNDYVNVSARQVPFLSTEPIFQQNVEVSDPAEVLFTYIIGTEVKITDTFGIQAEASYFNSEHIEGHRFALNGVYRF